MKRLLRTIYLLTVFDISATITGIKLNLIVEGNPLLYKAMTDFPFVTGFLMCLITGALLYGIYRVQHRIRWLIYPAAGLLMAKTVVVGMHIGWILMALKGAFII